MLFGSSQRLFDPDIALLLTGVTFLHHRPQPLRFGCSSGFARWAERLSFRVAILGRAHTADGFISKNDASLPLRLQQRSTIGLHMSESVAAYR